MAIKINFDASKNPEQSTFILARRNGHMIGQLDAKHIIIVDSLRDVSEIKFDVYKPTWKPNNEYEQQKLDYLLNIWDNLVDFKLVYCPEFNMWFETKVTLNESDSTDKNVSCTQLGIAELSNIKLYNIEINTETDISRPEYEKPSVLYREDDPKSSILHRIFEKAPHYKIIHVDSTIANIQRTFSFDGVSLYDACHSIEEEIGCIFIYHSNSDENGNIQRTVSVYDMESNCLDCNHRGEFTDKCPKCNSTNILTGYGEDTTIFVTSDTLADSLQYSTDTDSVKNCFKLTAGDDLMTATIRNCNPNGSDYIWHISSDTKSDMSNDLVTRLDNYDKDYDYYQKEYVAELNEESLSQYNELVSKYVQYNDELKTISSPVTGYPNLMNAYYNTLDLAMFLEHELMPDATLEDTTASDQAALLTSTTLSPISVTDVSTISLATADSNVLAMAKVLIDSRYQVKVNSSSLDKQTWTGDFVITNYSNEDDTAISETITITIDDDYENYVRQKLDKALHKSDVEDKSIVGLFKKEYEDFCNELKKYCLNRLTSFQNACQTCLDILVEQGVADKSTWANSNPNLYEELYVPYYDKLQAIESEMKVREDELIIIVGKRDENDKIEIYGLQNYIIEIKNMIQDKLDFEKYLGETLWLEFCAYRREDEYTNDNYISDGLDNAELFQRALEFIEVAQKEIYKSSEWQHSITTTLKNLLVIEKFQPLVQYFNVGNWIRVEIDGTIYKLRLLSYEVDYDKLSDIQVTFSDVLKLADGMSDVDSVLEQAASISKSYDTVKRQAKQGESSSAWLNNWVNKGLSLTHMKIVNSADNQNITWDSHGILCRRYIPETDSYDDRMSKIINDGIYMTDDAWRSSRAAIGRFMYYDPVDGKQKESYGVIANTLIGNLMLSEKVGVYNEDATIMLDNNGITLTTNNLEDTSKITSFTIQKEMKDENNETTLLPMFYVDSNGDLVLNGSLKVSSNINEEITSLDDICDDTRLTDKVTTIVDAQLDPVYQTIDDRYNSVMDEASKQLNDYKAEVGQYMEFDEDGLTLGASNSAFKTVIDNQRLAFKENDSTVAYISNSQLNILNAIIRNSLVLGKFFFSPRSDGGVSVTWQD